MKPLLILTMLLCSMVASSQTTWQEHYNSQGITIMSHDGECSYGPENPVLTYKFIKVENTTAVRAKISFQLNIMYNGQCMGCDGSYEYHSEVVLEPNSSKEGACDVYQLPARLDVLTHNPNLYALQFGGFVIADVQIEWIQ